MTITIVYIFIVSNAKNHPGQDLGPEENGIKAKLDLVLPLGVK